MMMLSNRKARQEDAKNAMTIRSRHSVYPFLPSGMRILGELCASFGHFAVANKVQISVIIERLAGHGNSYVR